MSNTKTNIISLLLFLISITFALFTSGIITLACGSCDTTANQNTQTPSTTTITKSTIDKLINSAKDNLNNSKTVVDNGVINTKENIETAKENVEDAKNGVIPALPENNSCGCACNCTHPNNPVDPTKPTTPVTNVTPVVVVPNISPKPALGVGNGDLNENPVLPNSLILIRTGGK
jgi:hypothetical protein